jgi:hypothetical protein
MTPCSPLEYYWNFGGICCLHLLGRRVVGDVDMRKDNHTNIRDLELVHHFVTISVHLPSQSHTSPLYTCLLVIGNVLSTTTYCTSSASKSKLCYDWLSVSQYVLMSSPFWFSWPDVCYCLMITVVTLWVALSDERSGLSAALFTHLSVHIWLFTFQMFNIQIRVHTLYLRPLSVRAQYSNLCPTNELSLIVFLSLKM